MSRQQLRSHINYTIKALEQAEQRLEDVPKWSGGVEKHATKAHLHIVKAQKELERAKGYVR